MYNLLMVYREGTWDEDEFFLELPRYLEHTAQPLKDRFNALNDQVIDALKAMPTLFAYEDRGREIGIPARVGWIDQVQVRYGGIRITWRFDASISPIPAERVREMFADLDIGERNWEQTRTHWAIKDVDLREVLVAHGLAIELRAPTVFVSYSWDSEEHRNWVRQLVLELRANGIDAMADMTHVRPGQDLGRFMEQTANCDRVIVVCTANYMGRANDRVGGVGYEHLVTAAQLMADPGSVRFIPVLKDHADAAHLPINLRGRMYVDLSDGPNRNANFQDLVRDLHNAYEPIPPLGPRPRF
ncbi:TPA: toll/interleukin-1 receptor domain-containing protein [Stenotrophomonas maltophilia]|nr:toll/interleukin-1 receptor domain-containing protein [Stenotrophomonas maltophilia]